MNSPRHLLILLGFLAQGMTWDSYPFLLGVGILWFVALKNAGKVQLSLRAEGLVLLFGCAVSLAITKSLHRSSHFFLGDGLILLQAVRLLRPLNHREKITSIIIAAFHFGVLCTLAPNIRFVLLYVGALFLFPGALKEVAAEKSAEALPNPPQRAYRLLPSARVCFWLLLGSAIVFVSFPRFTGTPLQLREGLGDQGSLLDSILDPRRGGRANSQQVLMQIEGDNVGYMRALALTEFDGVRWSADRGSRLVRFRSLAPRQEAKYRSRVVYVKNSQYLGRILPVDGFPVHIEGNFMSHPFVTPDGVLECSVMFTTGNNIYSYYVDPSEPPETLSVERRRHLTRHPKQSEALQLWVRDKSREGTNAYQKALLLTKYLRDNFTYELGTPELNRLAPVDDFVFQRRSGHCERFAASLALMLRMQGIPSRVAIGYVPTTRNLFNGRAQVRFRDAHSWTEAYFDELGWVQLDATPGPPPSGTGSDFLDLVDALDFAWYSHIVNFNGIAQKQFFTSGKQMLGKMPDISRSPVILALGGLIVILLGWRLIRRAPRRPSKQTPVNRQTAAARHRYEKMLRILESRGAARRQHQTPLEFLDRLRSTPDIHHDDVKLVTDDFCSTFYGQKSGSDDEPAVAAAFDRLRRG